MPFNFKGRTIAKVSVIGSGQIGPDIALYFAKVFHQSGVRVVVVDVSVDALKAGRERCEKKISKGVESGAFTAEQQGGMLDALVFTSDYDETRGSNIVVEAASENLVLKRRIFGQLQNLAAPGAILASNSSHLPPDVIFAEIADKSRCTIIHYFFPAERNPVVEIAPASAMSAENASFLLALYENIGKVPIKVKGRYGYAIDPIFEGIFLSAAMLVDEGVEEVKEVDFVAKEALGLTVGPFTAMNLTGGNPITLEGLTHYPEHIHPWFRIPKCLAKQMEKKAPWQVAGRGEDVFVTEGAKEVIVRDLRAAFFMLAGEIVDAGVSNIGDLDMACEIALDLRGPFRFMNELGHKEVITLVRNYASKTKGFVPKCIEEWSAGGKPFRIPYLVREDQGDVAVVKIRRPKVLNALNAEIFRQIDDEFKSIGNDPKFRAAVLTGFGSKAFVSGADVGFLAALKTKGEGESTCNESQKPMFTIESLGKPVVCAMNGLAFGGGNELAMSCTERVAKEGQKVFVSQPEVNLGLIPGAGGTQRLSRIIGVEEASKMMRTARAISSKEALRLGLISEEVPGDVVDRAVQIARDLADGKRSPMDWPKTPLAPVKSLPDVELGHLSKKIDEILCRAILEGAKMNLRDGCANEAKLFGECVETADYRIGVTNFIENGPRSKAAFEHK
ncbi:MAG: 3-hydroxyacyl-CoA dehydrogenase/enoyl-CoA hydratase family protein [Planctomycetes bacterium]|nr:3-hydroxyacyl-CoA dehydrogenase/enoyl-CoA hydratase family protein [Planctomycetota bacterium]